MTKMSVVFGGLGLLAFCGNTAGAQSVHRSCKAVIEHQPTACVMAPREGSTVQGPSVRVVLDAKNISIAPAAAAKAGAAHYHILLDANMPEDVTAAIPADVPGIVHLGKGQKEYTFENVAPGGHRLIVVLGDNGHVPVPRQRPDTVYFTVAARQ
jgi:hypothetical protein